MYEHLRFLSWARLAWLVFLWAPAKSKADLLEPSTFRSGAVAIYISLAWDWQSGRKRHWAAGSGGLCSTWHLTLLLLSFLSFFLSELVFLSHILPPYRSSPASPLFSCFPLLLRLLLSFAFLPPPSSPLDLDVKASQAVWSLSAGCQGRDTAHWDPEWDKLTVTMFPLSMWSWEKEKVKRRARWLRGRGEERGWEALGGREREPDSSLKCMNLRRILNHAALFTSHCLPVHIHTRT